MQELLFVEGALFEFKCMNVDSRLMFDFFFRVAFFNSMLEYYQYEF